MQELQRRQKEEKVLNDMLNDKEGAYKRSLEGRIAHVTDLQYGQHQNIFATSYSSIHKAAADGNDAGIHYFLGLKTKPRVHVDDYDKFGICAIHYAAEKGYNHIVDLLVSKGCPVDIPTTDGMTPFMYAAKNNRLETMESLVINHRADTIAVNRAGMTAAHFAAQLDHVDAFETLLKLNALAKERAMDEIAAAEMAAENPDEVAAEADKKARAQLKKSHETAPAKGEGGSGKAEHKKGGAKASAHADDDASVGSHSSFSSSMAGLKAPVLEGGAKAKEGKVAAPGGADGSEEIDANPADVLRRKYEALLRLPDTAIVDIPSRNGTRPVHIAATYSSLRCLQLLIRVGANFNSQDTAGENALHKAARRCNTDAYKLLLAAGGQENVKNTSRESALELLKDASFI
jgi:ankyrin repeat protein